MPHNHYSIHVNVYFSYLYLYNLYINTSKTWRDQCTTETTWGNIIDAMKSRIVRQNCVAKEIQEYVLNINLSGVIQSKRIVALNVSTSSKKHLSVQV